MDNPSSQTLTDSFFLVQSRVDQELRNPDFQRAVSAMRPLVSKEAFETREAARNCIQRLIFEKPGHKLDEFDLCAIALSCDVAISALEDYATLQEGHINDIKKMISNIDEYLGDPTRLRPINFLMQASPGAGKTHFIHCIARALAAPKGDRTKGIRGVKAITFNMAGMNNSEELIKPLDEARNVKIDDYVPLLFLDEFDSSPSNFGLLLPLLWDGSLGLGHRDLALGKSLIVLAGSSKLLPKALARGKSMKADDPRSDDKIDEIPKLVDLLSRINGSILSVPRLNDRPHDMIPITLALLRRRFGPGLRFIPWSLLHLVARLTFRYDVRSITHLVDCIPYSPNVVRLTTDKLGLPLATRSDFENSSLIYHLVSDADGLDGVIGLWREASATDYAVPVPQMRPLRMHGDQDRFIASRVLEIKRHLNHPI